jgi:hypothetical protein
MTKVGLSSTGVPHYARLHLCNFLSKLAYVFFTLSPLFKFQVVTAKTWTRCVFVTLANQLRETECVAKGGREGGLNVKADGRPIYNSYSKTNQMHQFLKLFIFA